MRGDLSPELLLKVNDLFNYKSWRIDSNPKNDVSLFSRFCERLKIFNRDEQQLLIDLAYDYELFPITSYDEKFLESFFDINENLASNANDIFVLPLLMPYKYSREGGIIGVNEESKSSTFLHYYLNSLDLSWVDHLDRASFLKNINQLKAKNIDNSLILFVDDFIGSGQTAIDVISAYNDAFDEIDLLNQATIIVITITGQKAGIERIKNSLGVTVLCAYTRRKGISDKFNSPIKENNVDMMKAMEKKAGCKEKYSLGFGKVEALVTMLEKTPNNTFPIFWHETATKAAPFPRYSKYKRKNGRK